MIPMKKENSGKRRRIEGEAKTMIKKKKKKEKKLKKKKKKKKETRSTTGKTTYTHGSFLIYIYMYI